MGHGSLLAGRYRLEERVRTGPDGSLWRAVDETLDRPVSVRVVRPGHRYTADVVDAARRAALVEDPRLARVLDVGEADGSAYLVAEHLVGRTLEELLADGPLPAPAARRLAGEAAEALDRASARGLHHLRLGPASLVVGLDGVVKVLGTAVDAALAGIEQDGDPVGADRADAVGLVRLLYAGLTGRWPEGTTGTGGMVRTPVPPGDLVAGIPNDLDTLCSVTLGPHDDGPRSPGELALELAPWPPTEPLALIRGQESVRVPAAPRARVPPPPAPGAPDPAGVPGPPRQAVHAVGTASVTGRGPEPGGAARSPQTWSAVPSTERPVQPPQPAQPPQPPTGPATPPAADRRGSDSDDMWSMLAAARPSAQHPAPSSATDEPLGPFIPPAPLSRPPRDQTRFVISVLAAVVVLGLVLAVLGLARGLSSSSDAESPALAETAPSATAPVSPPTAPASPGPASPSTESSASGSATPDPSASPASITAIEAIDPEGDGSEGGGTAPRAIDDDPDTTWRSDRYNSAAFGGLKKGLGLFLRLDPGRITSVRLDMPGSGAEVELRTATGPGLDGSVVVATAGQEDGAVVLTPEQPVQGGPLLIWFTRAPRQSSGEFRVVVSEITVS